MNLKLGDKVRVKSHSPKNPNPIRTVKKINSDGTVVLDGLPDNTYRNDDLELA